MLIEGYKNFYSCLLVARAERSQTCLTLSMDKSTPILKRIFLILKGLFLCHNKWFGDYLTLWIICTISEDNKELTAFCIEIARSITLMNSLRMKLWKVFLAEFMHNSLIDWSMVDRVFGLFKIDGTSITYSIISFKIIKIDYSE